MRVVFVVIALPLLIWAPPAQVELPRFSADLVRPLFEQPNQQQAREAVSGKGGGCKESYRGDRDDPEIGDQQGTSGVLVEPQRNGQDIAHPSFGKGFNRQCGRLLVFDAIKIDEASVLGEDAGALVSSIVLWHCEIFHGSVKLSPRRW